MSITKIGGEDLARHRVIVMSFHESGTLAMDGSK